MSNLSCQRFLKFIDSEEAEELLKISRNAFCLLLIIAKRARRYEGHADGLKPGEAHIGDWNKFGFTEREYRTAKDILVLRKHIEIVETNRTRKKTTTGTTTKGTLVKLISSSVYDINIEMKDDSKDVRATTDRRLTDDEQERTRKNNIEKEQQQQISKSINPYLEPKVVGVSLNLLKDLDLPDHEKRKLLKYGPERIRLAVEFASCEKEFNKSLMHCLIWHCSQKIPPLPSKVSNLYTKQQELAFKFNESLKEMGFVDLWRENQNHIEESYFYVPFERKDVNPPKLGETKIKLNIPISEIQNEILVSITSIGMYKKKKNGSR